MTRNAMQKVPRAKVTQDNLTFPFPLSPSPFFQSLCFHYTHFPFPPRPLALRHQPASSPPEQRHLVSHTHPTPSLPYRQPTVPTSLSPPAHQRPTHKPFSSSHRLDSILPQPLPAGFLLAYFPHSK